MTILEVRDLNKRFGGLQAVGDVSFSVQQGSIKALIGPNGAGKTTLFNLLSGMLPPDSGTIRFINDDVQRLQTYKFAAMGMSRTFQHIRLFPHMTALENIMIGRHMHSKAGFIAGMLSLPWTRKEEKTVGSAPSISCPFSALPTSPIPCHPPGSVPANTRRRPG